MVNNVRLTVRQAARLGVLLNYGPQTRRPIDTELDAMGWTERYDGDETGTDVVDGAAERLYGENGDIREDLMPFDWLTGGSNPPIDVPFQVVLPTWYRRLVQEVG